MEYDIIFESKREKIIEKVNDYLKNGWKCQGGICVIAQSEFAAFGQYYYQAMIKDDCSPDQTEQNE